MHTRPLLASLLLFLSIPAFAQNLAGTYKDDKLSLTLTPASAGAYTGTVEMGGRSFPVNAAATGNILTGKFSQGARAFDFTATLTGGTLAFKTGATVYNLEREGGPPPAANPADPKDPAAPAAPPPTDAIPADKIQLAIQKGIAYLHAKQKGGHWDLPARAPEPRANAQGMINMIDIQNSNQWGGLSGLATYALLAAGERDTDPSVVAAVAWLKTADITGTYALATRALVWNAMPNSKKRDYVEFAKRDRDALLKNRRDQVTKSMFRYTAYDRDVDNSASQFGLLGLWACNQVGAEVPAQFWKDAEASWIAAQDPSGGWNYGKAFIANRNVSAAMTAAGVASLFIINDQLHGDAGINCTGNVPHKQIDAGLKWINNHYDSVFTTMPYYTLYGVERIGLASGYKYLGSVDWYRHGALRLIGTQQPDGSWGDSVSDTCFGILFLARGRNPVVMNKLQYGLNANGDKAREANWNQRPRDAANFTRWLGRQLERDLNWQIVDLDHPVEDLHDAPILYIAGNQPLAFTGPEEAKLKAFVEQGGVIVGNADCSDARFVASFKKLGTKMFGGEFRELPAEHPIFSALFDRKKWKMPIPVQGLTNGARELMILMPAVDPARFWQTGAYLGREPTHELMADIFMYVSERRDLRFKGESWVVWPSNAVSPARAINVARLKYAGNWDPEPGGWRRLAAVLHNENVAELSTDAIAPGEGKLSAAEHKLAHLTAAGGKVTFTAAQQAELKAYIEAGGTLLVDSCGGDVDTADSLGAALTALGGAKPQVLPPDHPLYANLGVAANQVAFRPFATRQIGNAKGPRLKAIMVKGRPAILFSPEDLSAGLVGQPIDGITGYTPASATAIVRSIVLTTGG